MELWIDSYDLFCSTTHMISNAFKCFFGSGFNSKADHFQLHSHGSYSYLQVSTSFEDISRDIHQYLQPSVREMFTNRCLKPLLAVLSLVPPINDLITSRKTMLLDFDSFRAKLEKEIAAGRDASHPSSNKNLMKLDESSKRLWEVQQNIYALFDEFESAKGVMLGAEFTAFLGCFHHHFSCVTDITSRILPAIPQVCSTLSILESTMHRIAQQAPSSSASTTAHSAFSSVLDKLIAFTGKEASSQLMSDTSETPEVFHPSLFAQVTDANPVLALPCTQLLAKQELEHPLLPPIPPIIRRPEILGGPFGGYGTKSSDERTTRKSAHMYIANELKSQLMNSTSSSSSSSSSKKGNEIRSSLSVYYDDAYGAASLEIDDKSPFHPADGDKSEISYTENALDGSAKRAIASSILNSMASKIKSAGIAAGGSSNANEDGDSSSLIEGAEEEHFEVEREELSEVALKRCSNRFAPPPKPPKIRSTEPVSISTEPQDKEETIPVPLIEHMKEETTVNTPFSDAEEEQLLLQKLQNVSIEKNNTLEDEVKPGEGGERERESDYEPTALT